jgi:hypothetical protein
MSESDVPLEDRSLQHDQDGEAPEARPDEDEGPSRTPQARTDHGQDDQDRPADS